jgi:uncharacterized SAM-binding protein YcdF (DUF218 family)
MDFATARLIETLLLPPAGPFLVALLGLLLWRWKIGCRLLTLGLLVLYASSAPLIANTLIQGLQHYEPLTPQSLDESGVEAIVVLGGGYYGESEEYGEATVGPFFLERLRYAAWLYRRTGVPVVISSGRSDSYTAAQILVEELAVPVLAVEDASWTTRDNARNTLKILREKGLGKVALVTHGWHMPRAMYSFAEGGLRELIPAPMGLADPAPNPGDWRQWVPSARALLRTRTALHEYLGSFWYRNQTRIEQWLNPGGDTPSGGPG